MRKEPAPSWEKIDFLKNSQMDYLSIWEFQKMRLEQIAAGEAPEALIFCEHESLITKGRRAQSENLLSSKLPVHEIERGGDYTWHGPGQLVIYPLFRLQGSLFRRGLHDFLRFWEEVLIQVLEARGLTAGRFGPTGVWIQRDSGELKKIASIGVAVRRWITYHGLSINVSNDLSEFSNIRPCNFEASVMTNLLSEGTSVSLSVLASLIENKALQLLSENWVYEIESIPSSRVSV